MCEASDIFSIQGSSEINDRGQRWVQFWFYYEHYNLEICKQGQTGPVSSSHGMATMLPGKM